MNEKSQQSWACTPGAVEKKLGAWVNAVGWFRTNEHLLDSRTFDQALLIYCLEGRGHYRLGSRTIVIEAGDLFHVPPHLNHGYGSERVVGWEIKWTHFQGAYAERLVAMAGFSPANPVRRIGISKTLIGQFDSLLGVVRRKEMNYGVDASGMLLLILLELIKMPARQQRNMRLLEAISAESGDIDEAANVAGYSRFHFARLFKKTTGVSPWNYALRLKIDKAKELLLSTDRPVKEVADAVGFDDPNYFCRIFRKKTGVPPSRFRSLTREGGR